VVAVALAIGVAILLRRVTAGRQSVRTGTPLGEPAAASGVPKAHVTPIWRSDLDDGEASEDQAYKADPLSPLTDTAEAWAQVDFDEIRTAMPDNLYWKMAFPTKDSALIKEREERREQWNVEYGKVLSNTATDEEIDAYYGEQQKLSNDYLEFLVYLGTHYGTIVPKGEIGMLKLAGELHLARLEEIPRKIAEAKERHAAHETARRAWLEEQKAFQDHPPAAR
jgi:hypothetical protein